jgi:GNAT superfamily N-acetyltransferase
LTVIIRRARSEESGYLTGLTIRSKAHWGYEAAFMEAVRDELEFQPSKFQPDFHVYILEENGERLGFCSLIPIDRETIELHDLFLDPERIGKGYGKQLWSYAVNLARDLGYYKLILTADPHAEPFYARQGAVRIGEKASKAFPARQLPQMEYSLLDRRRTLPANS